MSQGKMSNLRKHLVKQVGGRPANVSEWVSEFFFVQLSRLSKVRRVKYAGYISQLIFYNWKYFFATTELCYEKWHC